MSNPPPYSSAQQGYMPGYQQQPYPPQPGAMPQQQGYAQNLPTPVYMPATAATGVVGARIDDVEAPKYDEGVGFSNKTIRAGFIRKVFAIVTLQLTFVALVVAFFTFHEPSKRFIRSSGWGTALYYGSYVTFLTTYITLICCEGPRRKHPINLILLGFLTISMAYMTAMIAAFHDTTIVCMTAGICAVCCFGIILFACQTKYDFTSCMGVMTVVMFVVFIFGIIAVFVAIFTKNMIMYLIYAGIMALVLMVFLAIDVQMIVGGKKHEISPEEYVLAALMLFVDIVYIFWMLLQLIGGVSR